MEDRIRIGLFGGSFDPIHTGHLILAQVALDFIGLEKVLFIPTAVPPHKDRGCLSDFTLRKRMIELAIEDNPGFELSSLEEGEWVSYTCDTILHFKKEGLGREQIHLLVGSDSLVEIQTWRNPEVIFSNATIVALQRPGYRGMPALPQEAAVIMIETGSNSISSSEIRKLAREGKSIRYLVPSSVERYIIDNSLYNETT